MIAPFIFNVNVTHYKGKNEKKKNTKKKKKKKNKQKRERGRGKKGENKIKLESVEERRARFKREASNTGREVVFLSFLFCCLFSPFK